MRAADVTPNTRRRTRFGPFVGDFLSPLVWGTSILLLVVLAADPGAFGSNWPLAPILGVAFAFWCFVGYLISSRKDRAGVLRKLH